MDNFRSLIRDLRNDAQRNKSQEPPQLVEITTLTFGIILETIAGRIESALFRDFGKELPRN